MAPCIDLFLAENVALVRSCKLKFKHAGEGTIGEVMRFKLVRDNRSGVIEQIPSKRPGMLDLIAVQTQFQPSFKIQVLSYL